MCRPAEPISTQKPQPTEQKADIPSKNVFAMFGNMMKHLHKLGKLSPLFSPEVRICLRSYIKHSH